MNSKLHESTPDFVKKLYEQQGFSLRDLSSHLLLEIGVLRQLSNRDKNEKELIFEGFQTLSNFTNYISLELCSVSRSNFRAVLPAEKRYNVKYINCVILEAYKYLYGYGKAQKKSLWVKKIKPLVELIDYQGFRNEYNSLELKIRQFGESNITDWTGRKLSFHYDLDPMEMYRHLVALSEEDEYQRLITFSTLMEELTVFSSKYLQKSNLTNVLISEMSPAIDLPIIGLEQFFLDDEGKLSDTLYGVIETHSKKLDEFARQQDTPDKFKEFFKQDLNDTIISMVELSKVVMQLSYLYIDLASAIRAFLHSEYIMEKLFNLKMINVIVYEGFNKLYSLNEESNGSFWHDRIIPFVSTIKDDRFCREVDILEQELEELAPIFKKYASQRQLSVHYDKGIPMIYDMLQGLNPFIELSKSTQLLQLMHKIYNILNQCMLLIETREEIENKKAIDNVSTIIEKIIALSTNLPDESFKKRLLDDLQKMKTGEFFENLLKNRPKD